MKARLVDDEVKLYAEPSHETISIATLKKGTEFDLGKVSRKNREVWVQVTLAGGQVGYMTGETRIFTIKQIQTITAALDMYESPSDESKVIKSYPKNSILTAVAIEEDGDKGWVKVIDEDGLEGYVKGGARIRLYQQATIEGARKLLVTGGIFILVSAGLYIFTISQSRSTGNMDFLIMAVAAFGLMQLVQGILQYSKAKKIDKSKNKA